MFVVLFFSFASVSNATEDEQALLEQFHAEQQEASTASEETSPFQFDDESTAIQPATDLTAEEVILSPVVERHYNTVEEIALPTTVVNTASPFSIGLRYPLGPSGSSVSLPATPGFTVSSEESRNIEIFGEYRENNLAIEVGVTFDDERSHELFFYGSPLGKMTVTGPQWSVAGKYYLPYFHNVHDVEPYIGIGFQQMTVDGFYGMGGVPFETKGDGWHAVGIIGAKFPVWKNYSVIAEYRLASTELATEIPNAGRLDIETGDKIVLGVSAHF